MRPHVPLALAGTTLLAVAAAAPGSFLLPAGSKVVGHFTRDGVELSVVPVEASAGLGPAYECTNDVRKWDSRYPLTATPTATVAPNFASQGACTGEEGLFGTVRAFEFRTSGDRGGAINLWDPSGPGSRFYLACGPVVSSYGAGVGDAFATTLMHDETRCSVEWTGPSPSEWPAFDGEAQNWNVAYGITHALVVAG